MFIYSNSWVNDWHTVSTLQQDSVNKPNYKFIKETRNATDSKCLVIPHPAHSHW